MGFSGQLVETPSGRIFVHRGGAGEPLVLIHGFLVSQHYFASILPRLERHFSVIALDLPAHGESDRPSPARYAYDLPSLAQTVADTMEALGVERAHVLGHSMGGGTALTLAARHPGRVDRLVLEDPAILPVPIPLIAKLALQPTVGKFLVEHVYSRRDLRTHLGRAYRDPALCTGELIDFYWERFNRAGTRAAVHAILRSLAALVDDPGDPGRVVAPTLIVWGDEDRIVPGSHGKRLVRQIPGARLEVVPACGHSPHEERPDELLRLVLPFLQAGAAKAQAV